MPFIPPSAAGRQIGADPRDPSALLTQAGTPPPARIAPDTPGEGVARIVVEEKLAD